MSLSTFFSESWTLCCTEWTCQSFFSRPFKFWQNHAYTRDFDIEADGSWTLWSNLEQHWEITTSIIPSEVGKSGQILLPDKNRSQCVPCARLTSDTWTSCLVSNMVANCRRGLPHRTLPHFQADLHWSYRVWRNNLWQYTARTLATYIGSCQSTVKSSSWRYMHYSTAFNQDTHQIQEQALLLLLWLSQENIIYFRIVN